MKTKISAMIDGELDAHELRDVCASLRHDEDLRRACTTYIVIGDALRREPFLATELAGAVADRLADEPVVLAPRALRDRLRERDAWQRPAMALAAMVAGIAVVAWLGLPRSAPEGEQLALAGAPAVHSAKVSEVADADMQEYLIAHQVHGGSFYLNNEAQHIRTVAFNGMESR